jgi:short-subunit dehydrogenase
MKPEYVAARTLEALRKNRAEVVLGWEAKWIIRANRICPRILDWGLKRYVRRRYPDQGNP